MGVLSCRLECLSACCEHRPKACFEANLRLCFRRMAAAASGETALVRGAVSDGEEPAVAQDATLSSTGRGGVRNGWRQRVTERLAENARPHQPLTTQQTRARRCIAERR